MPSLLSLRTHSALRSSGCRQPQPSVRSVRTTHDTRSRSRRRVTCESVVSCVRCTTVQSELCLSLEGGRWTPRSPRLPPTPVCMCEHPLAAAEGAQAARSGDASHTALPLRPQAHAGSSGGPALALAARSLSGVSHDLRRARRVRARAAMVSTRARATLTRSSPARAQ